MNKLKMREMGEHGLSIEWGEKIVHLDQKPHCDVPLNAYWDYQAVGKDNQGNQYLVKWEMYDCYKLGDEELDDEANACNWDVYTIEEL